jgi:hypothetical protein
MKANQITKFRWFWAWQDDKEETWLSAQAAEGYHLANIGPFGWYTFERGVPQQVVYRLDYQTGMQKDLPAYLQLFKDAGWEHVGELFGWHYFCKVVRPGEVLEIFTDNQSKAMKYRRLLGYLVIPVALLTVATSNLTRAEDIPYLVPFAFISFAILLMLIYAMLRIYHRIRQLSK